MAKPIDDGNYLFTTEERDAFLKLEPKAKKYFRRWLGADEFLNGYERWCLWLGDCSPAELAAMPHALKRVQAVRKFRNRSASAPTQGDCRPNALSCGELSCIGLPGHP